MRRVSPSSFALALALALPSAGCGLGGGVVRVYDGRVVHGSYVPPDAYAAYLRAVLDEESGNLARAALSLTLAAQLDDEDPEVWTRLGEVRCKANPSDPAADEAFARARRLDGTYAGALAAQSRCEASRGRIESAAKLAERATAEDPKNAGLEALLVTAEARRPDNRARDRAIALTILHGDRAVAWDALVTWARAHRDTELLARGLVGLLRASPSRSADVERGARELLGDGHLGLARVVAAAVADAPRELLVRGPRDEAVARLAIDEALARGDEDAAKARATRGHVDLAEVAARALLLERRDVATSIGHTVAGADPGASGARMVLAAAAHDMRPAKHPGEHLRKITDAPPALCALVLAVRIAAVAGNDVARAWLAQVNTRPFVPGDPLAGPFAVELAARGVLPPSGLTLDLRIELAARRREAPPSRTKEDVVDARHELLFLALTDPSGREVQSLVPRLSAALEHDPLVAFAIARVALADGGPNGAVLGRIREALRAGSTDALLLSAAVEVAKKLGGAEELTPARTRLMAVARTPAERALATEP
jgi:tetratricopeptide (TPR) repeat protein